jgi:hypothetical protein
VAVNDNLNNGRNAVSAFTLPSPIARHPISRVDFLVPIAATAFADSAVAKFRCFFRTKLPHNNRITAAIRHNTGFKLLKLFFRKRPKQFAEIFVYN